MKNIKLIAFFLLISSFAVAKSTVKEKEHAFEGLYATNYRALTGTIFGYCFPWSLVVATRQRGLAKGEPTLKEWKKIEKESNVDHLDGGASLQDVLNYWDSKHYESRINEMPVDDFTPYYDAAQSMDNSCIVQIAMFDERVGGHIETVVGIEHGEALTNSWGEKAEISTQGEFHHSHMRMFNTGSAEAIFIVSCPLPKIEVNYSKYNEKKIPKRFQHFRFNM